LKTTKTGDKVTPLELIEQEDAAAAAEKQRENEAKSAAIDAARIAYKRAIVEDKILTVAPEVLRSWMRQLHITTADVKADRIALAEMKRLESERTSDEAIAAAMEERTAEVEKTRALPVKQQAEREERAGALDRAWNNLERLKRNKKTTDDQIAAHKDKNPRVFS
jgi:hypothetical protein